MLDQQAVDRPGWIEVKAMLEGSIKDASLLVEVFRDHGVENTIETDSSLTGCLLNVSGSESIADRLALELKRAGAEDVELSRFDDHDWELAWREFFKPRRIGHRFVVSPSWEEFEPGPDDILLTLDPGQAFGTGDHPTTRLCLELIEGIDLVGQRALDIGCGSGILAIAAARLGATVSAYDVDPIAVEVTKRNAERNGVRLETWVANAVGSPGESVVHDELPIGDGPAVEDPASDGEYYLVLSNIISATLIRMSRQVASLVEPGGAWIVSGIIEENWPQVLQSATGSHFELVEERHEDGWVAAHFQRGSTVSESTREGNV